MKIHIVQKGDTLWKLAKKYGVSFDELKKVNSQLSNPDLLMPGMKVKIPNPTGGMNKEFVQPNIKTGIKEVPVQPHVSGVKEQPIIKEKLIKEQPIVKEKPIVKEIVKEKPIIIEKEIIKEKPIIKEIIKEKPIIIEKEIIKEKPIYITKEVPVPQPVAPPMKEKKKKIPVVPKPPKMPKTPSNIPAPVVEAPVAQQPVEQCIPVTPILPGTGFCYPPPPPLPVQFGCAPVEYVQQPVYAAPLANVESSNVWGESSPQYPFGSVAGASTYPVPQPYQAQSPISPSTYSGVPYSPAPTYGGSESTNLNQPVYGAQTNVQPAYQMKSKDCGCGKKDLGTYGPEKTHHSMHNPGITPQPYQNPQPGVGTQPYYQGPQPGVGTQPYYQGPQPGVGTQPYYQGPQPGVGTQPYYQGPQPGIGAQPYYHSPQPGIGAQPYYQNPQPGIGAQPYYQRPQQGAGTPPYYQSPQSGIGAPPYYTQPLPGTPAQTQYPIAGISGQPTYPRQQPSQYPPSSYTQPQTLPTQFGGQPGPFVPEQFGGVRAPETFGIPTFAEESDDF